MMTTMTEDDLLTPAEVAQRLRLHTETVRRWLKTGRMHGIYLGSDRAGWRIPASELERVLREGTPRPEREP
jgi:excisionase family DNA binding protein